jgi:hypothetical protein
MDRFRNLTFVFRNDTAHVHCHFSYIVAVSFIGGGSCNNVAPVNKLVCRQSYNAVPFVTMEQKKSCSWNIKTRYLRFKHFIRGNKWEMLSYEAWTDGRTAVCHNKPVFWRAYKNEWPISWNYEYIIVGQIIFQNFHQFKAFVRLSDCQTIGLSDCRIIATTPFCGIIVSTRKEKLSKMADKTNIL